MENRTRTDAARTAGKPDFEAVWDACDVLELGFFERSELRLIWFRSVGGSFQSMSLSPRPFLRFLKWVFLLAIGVALALLRWGDRLLVATDPMPSHVDAVVVLQGSIVAEKVRIAGGMGFLQRGAADRVLLSVPKESYWGQSIPPVARAYLERLYGSDLAARVDFCEASAQVNSTGEEAQAALGCIAEHHWQSIAVVTSDYHTRRAGILWRKAVTQHAPAMRVVIESVPDPEFQEPWWRHRQSAKIWLGETLKLLWTPLGG